MWKKYENNLKKHEINTNFGPRVGLHGWGGPNIGKQIILRTLELGNTGKNAF